MSRHRWEKDHTECPGIDGRITLQWIFNKWHGLVWPGSGYGQLAGYFVCGDEPLGSIKFWDVLD